MNSESAYLLALLEALGQQEGGVLLVDDNLPWELSATYEVVLQGRDPFNAVDPSETEPPPNFKESIKRGERPVPRGQGKQWWNKRCRK